MQVSHHPHGDWKLRVLANREVIVDKNVLSDLVTNEWLNVDVDLSRYAGQKIRLNIENRANNWHCEWAYWNEVRIVSE